MGQSPKKWNFDMCSVLYLDSILTIGARYSFLGSVLGCSGRQPPCLDTSALCLLDTKVHPRVRNHGEIGEGPYCMFYTSYCLRPLLDTLLQLIVELTKAKYRKEKSLWVNQNPNPFSGLYKPDLNSQYLYCSCSLLLRAGQHSASSEKLQCCCRVIASSPASWPLQF